MKNPKVPLVVETTNAGLISPGKSSRLQAMREKALSLQTAAVAAPAQEKVDFRSNAADLSPELLLARQMIDRQLDEILAGLPVGKQKSLFKIRYGVELELIRDLPIKRIFSLLKISPQQLNILSADMKRIAEVNYNGKLPTLPAV